MDSTPQASTPLTPSPSLSDDALPPLLPVRTTRSQRRLDAWSLTLISKGIPSLSQWAEGGFELYVQRENFAVARAELDAVDTEEHETERARRADAALEPTPVKRQAGLGAVAVALLLLAFFAATGPRAGDSWWFSAGAADAERVLHGEWWRAVTALTLHADGAHVLSNVGLGTLVVGAVMRSEGVGWGASLVLAAGTAGNLINAWAHHTLHSSVGFSTAVFGAIGLLGGLSYAHSKRRLRATRPAWVALAGSFALLALLGTSGERTDVFAHIFGLAAGLTFGLLAGWSGWRPKTAAGQWFAGLSAAATVLGAWFVALP